MKELIQRLFSGRINRRSYFVSSSGVGILVYILNELLQKTDATMFEVMLYIVLIPLIIVLYSLFIRRLHDLGYSGWFSLLIFVPVLNAAMGLGLIFFSGNLEANKYGNAPRPEFSFW